MTSKLSTGTGFAIATFVLASCTGTVSVPTPQVTATVSTPSVSVQTAPQPAPPPTSVIAVGATWAPSYYVESDWVANNMVLRARQFAAGYVPITDLVRGRMHEHERRTVVVTGAAGHCYRVIGVGGPGVRDLDLILRDMNGTIIDQDRAPDNYPVIGLDRPLCLPTNATIQLEIVMFSGSGEIGVQAFATQ